MRIQGRTFVSRFRSTELLEISADGQVLQRRKPESLMGSVTVPADTSQSSTTTGLFEPAVAWRTIQAPDGSIHMLHQRDQSTAIPVRGGSAPSYYGTGDLCKGIVRTVVSTFTPDNQVYSALAPSVMLAVDMAISSDGQFIAVASAGTSDLVPSQSVVTFDARVSQPEAIDSQHGRPPADQCTDTIRGYSTEPAVAVAFVPNSSTLLAQTRSPARLYFLSVDGTIGSLALGGGRVDDTAYDLFHLGTSAGIACASCHPEGTNDGRVWKFQDLGKRRTQSLDIGLEGTAPFHWDGAVPDVGALMDEVFVGRMGGEHQSADRIAALETWLFAIKPLPPRRSASDPLALRGQELFNSPEVGCSTCHSGPSFTNNHNYVVGTTASEPLQVPGLAGVGYRAPLMHDGCAATLRDRFDPNCGGGDAHGHTSTLSPEDIDALVAYLETL